MKEFKIRAAGKTAEIMIYGDIGGGFWGDGLTAKQFADELKQHPKVTDLAIRLNSSGGDVFEGIAIYNQIKRQNATISVDIDGAALSIASVIAMAADPGQLRMSDNAFMMIHDPWSLTVGDSQDHRKAAELLDGIKSQIVNTYVSRSQADPDEISAMMAEETWLDAKTAQELGFIDERTNELAMAAHVNTRICRNMPDYVRHWQEIAAKEAHARSEALKARLDRMTPILP